MGMFPYKCECCDGAYKKSIVETDDGTIYIPSKFIEFLDSWGC